MKRFYHAAINKFGHAKGQVFNIGDSIENSFSMLDMYALLEELASVKQ